MLGQIYYNVQQVTPKRVENIMVERLGVTEQWFRKSSINRHLELISSTYY